MAYISPALRREIAERAGFRCEYCQSSERITSGPMHIEHVIPTAAGGRTEPDNLAYACALCNLHKATRIHFSDLLAIEGRLFLTLAPNAGHATLPGAWTAYS